MKIEKMSVNELLIAFGQILNELRKRGIVRSQNNPVGDYTEWLVSKAFGLTLQNNSKSGFDAVDAKGVRYQIKGRRLHSRNESRQLGVIRNLEAEEFDFLIGVLFAEDFSVLEAYKIPYKLVGPPHSRFCRHQNGNILILNGAVLSAEGVVPVDKQLKDFLDKDV